MNAEPEEEEEGGAGWIMTFADLMSLLMCFFVLLLSFSEMDIQKYKQVAGSMKDAFGVQREVKSDVVPKGTSIVVDKFSPGRPDPDVLVNEMRQDTTDDFKENLEFYNVELNEQAANLAELLKQTLEAEIEQGLLEIILDRNEVSVRIHEKDSFPSASAELNPEFFPILDQIVVVLNNSKGLIRVDGHTDSLPIATNKFPSNWILSAARAARVVHYMVDGGLEDDSRIELRGYADTRPVSSNDTPENRARNRRIEIIVSFRSIQPDVDEDEFYFSDADEI